MFRMAACRYAAMLIVEPMLREYTVDTIYQTTDLDTIYSLLAKRCERDPMTSSPNGRTMRRGSGMTCPPAR